MQVLTNIRSRQLSGRQAIYATLAGALLTAVCANIAVPLPFTPVPITMQVFAFLCCGMLLGSKLGAIAQMEYVVAGVLGAPVFAGFRSGPSVFLGSDGGYLIGFIAAAFVIGRFIELTSDRSLRSMIMAGTLGVGMLYIFGAAWLAVWLAVVPNQFAGWGSWILGVVPFIGVDAVKVVAAAVICSRETH